MRTATLGQVVKNLQQEPDLSTEVIISQEAQFLLQYCPGQIADSFSLSDPMPSNYSLLFPQVPSWKVGRSHFQYNPLRTAGKNNTILKPLLH